MTGELSPAALALDERLRIGRTRRIPLAALWAAFVAVEPARATDPDKRARLAALCRDLAEAGRITLPTTSRSWERTPDPPLPHFVTIPRADPAGRRALSLNFPWHPALAWAASTPLPPRQDALLRAVHDFLVSGGESRPVAPIRERSLELCGDEKYLEEISGSALFGPGRLSLALLRAELVAEPIVTTRIGDGPILLVVENATAFRSIAPALSPDGPVGVIGFGRGWQFVASVGSARDLQPTVRVIRYFGDLDMAGLRIPIQAGRSAVAIGLPDVTPAAGLYRLLVAHGRPQPASRGPAPAYAEANSLAAWLPVDLRASVTAMLTARERLAQEWVGAELLARLPADELARLA